MSKKKLTESELKKVVREEIKRYGLINEQIEINDGVLKDGFDYVSRKDFEKHYDNKGKPSSTNYANSVKSLKRVDNTLHFLVSHLMDHDEIDHGLGDRVPEHEAWASEETWVQYLENLRNSDVEGDPGKSFVEMHERLHDLHARLHSLMAQHIRHHIDMGANDDVEDNT